MNTLAEILVIAASIAADYLGSCMHWLIPFPVSSE
jgi:hypothetical protein